MKLQWRFGTLSFKKSVCKNWNSIIAAAAEMKSPNLCPSDGYPTFSAVDFYMLG